MRYFLILLILVFSPEQLLAEKISSSDFAAGYYLEVGQKGPVYSLELPEDVYRTVKSAELSDVRVFNGAGEVVPHEFRMVKTDPKTLRDKENIPFFPLYQTSASNEQTGFLFQVSRDSAGAIVNIKPDPEVNVLDRKLTGYLLDLSDLQKTASELEFYWQKDTDSSVFSVSIQQSSDLIRWMPLVHRATLAYLQFSGQKVERRTVHLPRQPLKYLKLTWMESHQALRLTEISSSSRVIEARRKHRWISLYNGKVREKDDQLMLDFATSYRLPTSSVQIRFPETNSIARLSVQSRPDADATWRIRCEQVFHDLSFEGAAIQNEPCRFASTADSLWRVVVKQDGAGLLSDKKKVSLLLGWQPSELLFVGRGTPPYLLAFGSGKPALLDTNPNTGMLQQAMKMESSSQMIGRAALGKRITLGGESALQSPTQPVPWKKWLLWIVLVLGVGLLAFMVRSLTKEIRTAEEKRVSEER